MAEADLPDRPRLLPESEFYLEAFDALTTERPLGATGGLATSGARPSRTTRGTAASRGGRGRAAHPADRAMDAEYLDGLNEKQKADAEEAEAKRK